MKSIVGWTATLSFWSSSQFCYSVRSRSFVAAALCIPGGHDDNDKGGGDDNNDHDQVEIWRSNDTHIVWRRRRHGGGGGGSKADHHDDKERTPSMMIRHRPGTSGCSYLIQTMEDAKQEAYQYLRDNMMSLDVQYLETLGFPSSSHHHDNNINRTATASPPPVPPPDGLANGLVEQVVNVSLQAKIDFDYADGLPRPIWQQYVLNYSHLNEGRGNVRRLLRDRLVEPLLLNENSTISTTVTNRSVAETVRLVNQHMWTMLAPRSISANDDNDHHPPTIRFVAGQTPAIFDPTSVLAFGYASCTGTSILFTEALRAAGIAARVVGTAAWNGRREKGNHNWVEVYDSNSNINNNNNNDDDPARWKFLEPSPGLDRADSINDDPCTRWFCNAQHMDNGTLVYAAALERGNHNNNSRSTDVLYFPLAWQWDCTAVPAVNRTDYYRSVCSSCGGGGGGGRLLPPTLAAEVKEEATAPAQMANHQDKHSWSSSS